MDIYTIHENDFGTPFQVTVLDRDGKAINLSALTSFLFEFRKPGGAVFTRVPTALGLPSLGILQYTTASGDLASPGTWRVRVHYTGSGVDRHTDWGSFKVLGDDE